MKNKRNSKQNHKHNYWLTRQLMAVLMISTGLFLSACEDEDDEILGANDPSETTSEAASENLDPTDFRTNLFLPDSVTGGTDSSAAKSESNFSAKTTGSILRSLNNSDSQVSAKASDVPCSYLGADDEDIFKNGYQTTKFMISAVAQWSCFADELIELTNLLPHDGVIREVEENDADSVNHEEDEPTHWVISDSAGGDVTVKLYYGFGHSEPPTSEDEAGFYFTFLEDDDSTTGQFILDSVIIDDSEHEEGDPEQMRMDFDYGADTEVADMFLRFDSGNPWAEGFRIRVSKDLNTTDQVFTAEGLLDMGRQIIPVEEIEEIPGVELFSVSDAFGNGAARVAFVDLALSFPAEDNEDVHNGNYLTDKIDTYFFDNDGDWEWIEKHFENTIMVGDERTWNLAARLLIQLFLGLDSDYFDNFCDVDGADCNVLMNAVFKDGWGGSIENNPEANQGEDPEDWRSTAIENATYLESVYPDGFDSWEGVFEQN